MRVLLWRVAGRTALIRRRIGLETRSERSLRHCTPHCTAIHIHRVLQQEAR